MLSLFAVPISKPGTVFMLTLTLVGSLVGVDAIRRFQGASREFVVRGFLLWFGVVALSALHAGLRRGEWQEVTSSSLWIFCYPLILASVLTQASWRWRAVLSFGVGTALVLCVSYAMAFGLIPQRELTDAVPAMRNTVFKEYTQQGLGTLILCSIAIAIATSTSPESRTVRRLSGVVALAALVGVAVLLQSRTSYIVLAPIAFYWILRWMRSDRRHTQCMPAIGGTALLAVLTLAFVHTPNVEHRLLNGVTSEVQRYEQSQEPTSAGIRMHLWNESLFIAAAAPIFGHGFGQWQSLYEERMASFKGSGSFLVHHPHQELLLILCEEGAVGLIIFACLIYALWQLIGKLPDPQRGVFASLVLIYLTAGLFNGLWSDFTHRHMFVLLLACIPISEAKVLSQTRASA